MYQFHGGYVKPAGPQQRWRRQDVSAVPMKNLFIDYQDGYLFLTHPVYDGIQHLRFRDIPEYLGTSQSTLTVAEWVAALGNTGLPLQEGRVDYEEVETTFYDAWQLGCNILPIHPTYHFAQDIPFSEKRDLLIQHPTQDPQTLYQNWIVSVNGFLHYTGATPDGLQVFEGGDNGRRSNGNRVGMWYFGGLGGMSLHRVRREHLNTNTDVPFKDSVTLTLDPAVPIEGRSVFLVLGGIAQLEDHYVKQIGERTFKIEMRNYPFPQHVLDLKEHADLSSMTRYHDQSTANASQMALSQLYGDKSITAFLTLPHTFFVVVDTPELFTTYHQVEKTQLPGVVHTAEPPVYPLQHRLGRFVEYWPRHDGDRWSLYFADALETYYTFETTDWKAMNSIDSSRTPHRPYDYGRGFLVKMSGYPS